MDVRRQESARSSAARSAGAPCAGSTSSTGSASSDRSPSATCSRVTPCCSTSRGISKPVGYVNPSGARRGASGGLRGRRVGLFRSRAEGAASWWCRCCTCCFGVRLRSRRCVFARARSRSSRSWSFATSWPFFAVKSPVRGWTSLTGFSLLRPAGFSAGRAGRRSSFSRTHCWVGTANLYGDGGRVPDRDRAGPQSRQRSVSSCCDSRVRTHAGATSGSSVSSQC